MAQPQQPRQQQQQEQQQQRRRQHHRSRRESSGRRDTATKLTPAAIRSLNMTRVASRQGSGSPSALEYHHPAVRTPPQTPGHGLPRPKPLSSPGQDSESLTTAPVSPGRTTGTTTIRRTHIHTHTRSQSGENGLQINPRRLSQSQGQAGVVPASTHAQQPSPFSHHSAPVYRGHELTEPGSSLPLQSPTLIQRIVNNPLSHFSRPRQARGDVDPTQDERTAIRLGGLRNTYFRRSRPPSATGNMSHPTNHPSQPLTNTPPVPAVDNQLQAATPARSLKSSHSALSKRQALGVDQPRSPGRLSRFSWSWRKSSHAPLQDDQERTENKKIRRKSIFSWSRDSRADKLPSGHEEIKSSSTSERGNMSKMHSLLRRKSRQSQEVRRPLTVSGEVATQPAARSPDVPSAPISGSPGKDGEVGGEEGRPHNGDNDDNATAGPLSTDSRHSHRGRLKNPDMSPSWGPVHQLNPPETDASSDVDKTDETVHQQSSGLVSIEQKATSSVLAGTGAEDHQVETKIGPETSATPLQQPTPILIVNESGDVIAEGNQPIMSASHAMDTTPTQLKRFSSLYSRNIPPRAESDIQRRFSDFSDTTTVKAMPTTSSIWISGEPAATVKSVDSRTGSDSRQQQGQGLAVTDTSANMFPTDASEDVNSTVSSSYEADPILTLTAAYTPPEGTSSAAIPALIADEWTGAIQRIDAPPDESLHSGELVSSGRIDSSLYDAMEPSPESTAKHGQVESDTTTMTTTHQVVTRSPAPSVAEVSTSSQRSVSFEPAVIERHEMSENSSPRSSYHKPRSSRKSGTSSQSSYTSGYTSLSPNSNNIITTKPKATAQFMYRTHSDTQIPVMSSLAVPGMAGASTNQNERHLYQRDRRKVSPSAASGTARVPKGSGSGETPRSSNLSLPDLLEPSHPSTAETDLKAAPPRLSANSLTPPAGRRSNLVANVLAAARADPHSK